MPRPKTEQDAEALRLRIAGFSYAEIARRLNYQNRSGAWKAVERALAPGSGTDGIELELQRLDVLQRGVFTKALQGDVQAALAVVKIIDQRAKLSGHYRSAEEPAGETPPAPVEVRDPVNDFAARVAARRAAAAGS